MLQQRQGSQTEGAIRSGESTMTTSQQSTTVAALPQDEEEVEERKPSLANRMFSKVASSLSFSRKKKGASKQRNSLSNVDFEANPTSQQQSPTQITQPQQYQQPQVAAQQPPTPIATPAQAPKVTPQPPPVAIQQQQTYHQPSPVVHNSVPLQGEDASETWAKFDDTPDIQMPLKMSGKKSSTKQRKRRQSKPGLTAMTSPSASIETAKVDPYGLDSFPALQNTQQSTQVRNDPFNTMAWGTQPPYQTAARNPPPVIPNYGLSLDPFADIDTIPFPR
jgi:hypothetical protein